MGMFNHRSESLHRRELLVNESEDKEELLRSFPSHSVHLRTTFMNAPSSILRKGNKNKKNSRRAMSPSLRRRKTSQPTDTETDPTDSDSGRGISPPIKRVTIITSEKETTHQAPLVTSSSSEEHDPVESYVPPDPASTSAENSPVRTSTRPHRSRKLQREGPPKQQPSVTSSSRRRRRSTSRSRTTSTGMGKTPTPPSQSKLNATLNPFANKGQVYLCRDMASIADAMKLDLNTQVLLAYFDARTLEDFYLMADSDLQELVSKAKQMRRSLPPLQLRKIQVLREWLKEIVQRQEEEENSESKLPMWVRLTAAFQQQQQKSRKSRKRRQRKLIPEDWRDQFRRDLPKLKHRLRQKGDENSIFSFQRYVPSFQSITMCGLVQ